MPTKIEWADEVWNPVTGCTKVSEGCRHCYAERMAHRFTREGQHARLGCHYDTNDFADLLLHPDRLDQPLHWRKPRKVFVCSMSDLFHKDVPDEFIDAVFAVMAKCQQHTFMVLTKRESRMLDYMLHLQALMPHMQDTDERSLGKVRFGPGERFPNFPLTNVIGMVSVEDQGAADRRIPTLLAAPLALRGVSYEPALGPVEFAPHWLGQGAECPDCGIQQRVDEDGCCISCGQDSMWYGLDWVIAGGESGPGARPAHPDWFRSVRDQCQAAGVPFFFKQWGEWAPKEHFDGWETWDAAGAHAFVQREGGFVAVPGRDKPDIEIGLTCADLNGNEGGAAMARCGKKAAGNLLYGKVWAEFPGHHGIDAAEKKGGEK